MPRMAVDEKLARNLDAAVGGPHAQVIVEVLAGIQRFVETQRRGNRRAHKMTHLQRQKRIEQQQIIEAVHADDLRYA